MTRFSGLQMFSAMVLVPMALLAIYLLFIAADRFTSEASFTIKESGSAGQSLSLGILNVGNSSSREDEMIMEEYLKSDDMLQYLDDTLGLRKHYQSDEADVASRLWGNATREEFLQYYRGHIDVYFDQTSGLIFVEVQAFDRAFAKRLLETMLAKAEDFVNDINHQLALAQEEFAEKQLVTAQDNLKNAKQRLIAFQNEYHVFSPEQEGQSLTAIMDSLQGDLVKERTSLKQLLSYQNKTAPQVVATRERIKALAQQLEDEKARLVGTGSEKINDLLSQYINFQLDLEFAKDAYGSTLATLEQSRAEASKKAKHLVVVSRPSQADEAKYPDRVYILVTAAIVLLLLYGIARMVVATVREHQD